MQEARPFIEFEEPPSGDAATLKRVIEEQSLEIARLRVELTFAHDAQTLAVALKLDASA